MAKSAQLKIPIALDNKNRLYKPQNAEKEKHYFCPACQERVILRKGKIKTAHFAHKASETCNQETILHKTAKQLVVQSISDWKLGKSDVPRLKRNCEVCRESIEQLLPDKVEFAVLEYRIDKEFVVDVALMVENAPAAAVEIRISHAVDERKAKLLSIPFIELDGHEVIENPIVFLSLRDTFRWSCQTCKTAKKHFYTQAKKIAEQTGISLPANKYYRYGMHQCNTCKRDIIVFAWPNKGKPKVEPIPQTIQFCRYPPFHNKYWFNTCPYCKASQSRRDISVYGPFLTLSWLSNANAEKEARNTYHKDMQQIASLWYRETRQR
ncbi:MAG: competence protein CoiA family protein [Candidatus Poribacteria bacterium]|nr:competence protein CoiA family protein [Candidatus Poribacteria bacterium]